MFNYLQRILFALSSVSPMVIVAAFVAYASGNIQLLTVVLAVAISLAVFILGGLRFLHVAASSGEGISVKNSISTIKPSGQWLPVLFGSYFVPLISLLQTAVDFRWIVLITLVLTATALAAKNVPPAVFLLVAGYHFYELSLTNGAGGYKLISKKRMISDPKSVTRVVKLFDNEYWLLEKGA